MFTKEHYVEIAGMLRRSTQDVRISHAALIQDFVSLFEKDNSKFDVEKFLNTVYGKEEK